MFLNLHAVAWPGLDVDVDREETLELAVEEAEVEGDEGLPCPENEDADDVDEA